jgi:plastocyanin
MKRSISSMIGILTFCGIALSASSATADDKDRGKNVTVSFGQWDPNDPDLLAPLDRLLGDPAGGVGVNDILIPDNVTIKAGDAVNFIISGSHVVAVYEDGTQPGAIGDAIEPNCASPLPASGILAPCSPLNNAGQPAAGGILSDSAGRIYRGAFLNLVARRDGVEVVQFSKPGTYLVICARKTHFDNGMFGFVKVRKGK